MTAPPDVPWTHAEQPAASMTATRSSYPIDRERRGVAAVAASAAV
jgi:hypothetical protein